MTEGRMAWKEVG